MAINNHEPTTRRTVLAALGAAMLPGCRRGWTPPELDPTARSQVKPYVPGSEAFSTYEERWVASSCAQCPAACGIRVRVVEGRAVRIDGNLANPINRGGIGVRGLSGLQTLYDPDRITQPLRRIGDRLVPISWPDALTLLTRSLVELRVRAPERLLVMSGLQRGFSHDLLARLCRVFGTPNFVDGSPSHNATLARAMELSLGVREIPAYDWNGAGAILSLEAGLFEDACRSVYFARAVAGMRRDRARRARLIHAGPAFDLAAYNADRWLRIRPGTAGALALGLCHVLLRDDHYAHELVTDIRGFQALAAQYSPERVAAITGCAAPLVGELAHELWDRRPVLAVVDDRSLAYTNGLDTANVAIALSALLGSIENPNGGLRIAPAAPTSMWAEPALDDIARRSVAKPRLDRSERFPGAHSVLDTLPDAIRDAAPAVALLFHSNPLYSRAQPRRWREALEHVPLVVSFSPFLDETSAEVADLVLPDHTFLERCEDATPLPGAPRAVAGIRNPAVTPLYDTRATADVIVELAHRLGDPIAREFPWRSARDAFEQRWLGLHAAARGTIVEPSPKAFLDRFYQTGFWAETEDAPVTNVQITLPTAWSEPRWEGEPARYPLELVAYRPLGHAEGSGANQPWLRNLQARPGHGAWTFAASLSPSDAPTGVRSGDRVRVISPFGSLAIAVHIDPRIAPGCIAIPTGGGHRAFGRWARGFGVNVMELLPGTPAVDTGASLICTTRVRVEVVT
jgi:menaquinone reductase, molybdopterin-binding-like subunit